MSANNAGLPHSARARPSCGTTAGWRSTCGTRRRTRWTTRCDPRTPGHIWANSPVAWALAVLDARFLLEVVTRSAVRTS